MFARKDACVAGSLNGQRVLPLRHPTKKQTPRMKSAKSPLPTYKSSTRLAYTPHILTPALTPLMPVNRPKVAPDAKGPAVKPTGTDTTVATKGKTRGVRNVGKLARLLNMPDQIFFMVRPYSPR